MSLDEVTADSPAQPVDYDKRVCADWSEFAQAGKERITVRHLLAHQADLYAFDEPVDRDGQRIRYSARYERMEDLVGIQPAGREMVAQPPTGHLRGQYVERFYRQYARSGSGAAPSTRNPGETIVMNILLILDDPPYGTEKCYNALRLATALLKTDPEIQVTIFLMADAVGKNGTERFFRRIPPSPLLSHKLPLPPGEG